jgi:trimeric autotransporter adhesin
MFARYTKGSRQLVTLSSAALRFRPIAAVISAAFTLGSGIALAADTCPFDNGGSDALNDGVVLTRHALGITDSPLVASTRYASLDPLQVKNNIECVGCALDMNGDAQIDTVDTTIIARHLAGFSGASLTNGLALGSGSRNTEAAVTSFLANGCGATRNITGDSVNDNVFTVTNTSRGGAILGKAGNYGSNPLVGTGTGVIGEGGTGVWGRTDAIYGAGVFGSSSAISTEAVGVAGRGYIGVKGRTENGGYAIYSEGRLGVSDTGFADFGSKTRQMISLYGNGAYGIGIQAGTMYFRMDNTVSQFRDYGFSWYRGGSHVDENNKPGAGGVELMRLNSNKGDLYVLGSVFANTTLNTSDRNLKTLIQNINPSSILEKVAAMPISKWMYKSDEAKNWHIGPMAQDFRKAFGLGQDDKTIATIDADGIALAAIKGLNQKLLEKVKLKDDEIAALKSRLNAIERKLGF